MEVQLKTGTYIIAVSGGVDSVVLLDVLSRNKNLQLIVAHFEHGIRRDSNDDLEFVKNLAKKYDLTFEFAHGNLGKNASEETARNARYNFLRATKAKHGADAIILAHHQDDIIETMLINIMRGTNRRGLSSLKNTHEFLRPFLETPKSEIKTYAKEKNLQWREDSTNSDPKYLRNWLRTHVTPKLTAAQKVQLLQINADLKVLNSEVEEILQAEFGTKESELEKSVVINVSYDVACEIIADWLRNNNVAGFNKATIGRIVIGAKTLQSGKMIDVINGVKVLVSTKSLKINHNN